VSAWGVRLVVAHVLQTTGSSLIEATAHGSALSGEHWFQDPSYLYAFAGLSTSFHCAGSACKVQAQMWPFAAPWPAGRACTLCLAHQQPDWTQPFFEIHWITCSMVASSMPSGHCRQCYSWQAFLQCEQLTCESPHLQGR